MLISLDLTTVDLCYNARCCSCGFDITEDDLIIVGASTGVSARHPKLPFTTGVVGRSFPRPCSNESHTELCQIPSVPAYHLDCIRLQNERGHRGVNRKAFTDRFDPPPETKERRLRWLRNTYLHDLLETFQKVFPNEITSQIAEYASEDMRAWALEMRSRRTLWDPKTYKVSLDQELWASTVCLEGEKYLRILGPIHNDIRGSHRILPVNKDAPFDTLYIAEDHQGVVDIIPGDSERPPLREKQAGIWWMKTAIKPGASLEVQYDGTKIHSIRSDADDTNGAVTRWAVPTPSDLRVARILDHVFDQKKGLMRNAELNIDVLHCNQAETSGYLMRLTEDGRLYSIHAERAGEPLPVPLPDHGEELGGWLYMPIDKGEYIAGLWAQVETNSDLLIQTNTGRLLQTSECKPGSGGTSRYRIATLDAQVSRIFLETTILGVIALKFETPDPTPATMSYDANPVILGRADTRYPPWVFSSSAIMTNLQKIVPCRLGSARNITGLLLSFKDGHKEVLGQVHPDRLCPAEALETFPGWTLYLTLGDRSEGGIYDTVLKVALERQNWDIRAPIIEAGGDGVLHWWWTPERKGAKIRFGNSSEAAALLEEQARALNEIREQDLASTGA